MKFIAFHRLYALVERLPKKQVRNCSEFPEYSSNVTKAVEKVGKYLLRTRCLAQAIAVKLLLYRQGIESRLQIGFINVKNKLTAHAWIEAKGLVLTGGNPSLRFYFTIPFDDKISQLNSNGSERQMNMLYFTRDKIVRKG